MDPNQIGSYFFLREFGPGIRNVREWEVFYMNHQRAWIPTIQGYCLNSTGWTRAEGAAFRVRQTYSPFFWNAQ